MKKFKLILFAICYLLFTTLYADGVEASLANKEVVVGNMAQLKLKATGSSIEFPNIEEINGLPIIGRHKGSNSSYSYINGQMKSEQSTTLVLTFAPQKSMTIPSFKVTIDGKSYETKAIELKVVKATVPQANGKDKFALLMRANKKSVMVGEPLMVTVYFSLQHGVRLSDNPQYNKPEFKGFFVKDVEDQKTYNEGNRQVTELRYILTPKSEGNFTLEPATAKIGLADRNRRDMFGRFFGTSWVPIASNTLNITVEPKPNDSDLVGVFGIKNSIDSQSVKANKPVNLTVTIDGEGSLEDFEFPAYDIDGVTIYSDDAQITTNIVDNKLKSTFVKRFVFIADADFHIPKRELSLYDTKSKTLKYLNVPSYDIVVESTKAVNAVATTKEKNAGVVQSNIKVEKKSMLDDDTKQIEVKSTEWYIVALAFVLGLLVSYLFKFIPTISWKKRGIVKESEALTLLYPHINKSKDIEDMVKKLYAKKNGNTNIQIDKVKLRELVENNT